MKVCVTVPTTEGPAPITRLRRLSKAPRSVMLIHDDYRPLSISERYHAFVQAGSPFASRMDYGVDQFEVRLWRKIETGRSWELPVALAHWLLDQGHEVDVDEPKVLVWATGALDNDLCVLQRDYHLGRKFEQSLEYLKDNLRNGAQVIVFLPNSVELPSDLYCGSLQLHVVTSFDAAILALEAHLNSLEKEGFCETPSKGLRFRNNLFGTVASRVMVSFGLMAVVLLLLWVGGSDLMRASLVGSSAILLEAENNEYAPPETARPMPEISDAFADMGGQGEDASDNEPNQNVLALPVLELDYAPVDGSCQTVLFGSGSAERRNVAPDTTAYPDVRLNGLCAIGLSLPEATSSVFDVSLSESLLAVILPSDQSRSMSLRPGETKMLRLRAAVPDTLSGRIDFSIQGEVVGRLRFTGVR